MIKIYQPITYVIIIINKFFIISLMENSPFCIVIPGKPAINQFIPVNDMLYVEVHNPSQISQITFFLT